MPPTGIKKNLIDGEVVKWFNDFVDLSNHPQPLPPDTEFYHDKVAVLKLFQRYMLYKQLPSEGGLLDQEEYWMADIEICLKGIAYAEWRRDHPDEAQLLEMATTTPIDLSGVGDWADVING